MLEDDVLELRLLRRVRDVDQSAWDALVGEHGSPFVEWTWLDCLEQAKCVGPNTGWIPQHFALFRGDRLVAAAPAYLKGNSEGEFVFDWSWADLAQRMHLHYYPKLVFAVPFTPVTGERVLVMPGEDRTAITKSFAAAARSIMISDGTDGPGMPLSGAHVLFPDENEAAAWSEAGFVPRLGIQYHWRNERYGSWNDFLAKFTSKRRNQLKREVAQPAKDGVTIETLAPDALTPEVVEQMFDLYARTVDKFYYGRRYLNAEFFALVAERFGARMAWVVAKKDARIIAGAFNVAKGKKLYGRYWGATTELPFLHFNVCYYHGVKQCIEQGLEVFEPGAGGEHKRVRGFEPTRTHSAHWLSDPRLASVIGEFLARERNAIEAHIRGEGPDPEE